MISRRIGGEKPTPHGNDQSRATSTEVLRSLLVTVLIEWIAWIFWLEELPIRLGDLSLDPAKSGALILGPRRLY